MYPVSLEFKNDIQSLNREFELGITINHSSGQLFLGDEDIVSNTFVFNESTQSGDEFTIGGTVASDVSFELRDRVKYDTIELMGATIKPYVGLYIPSLNKFEYIPIGVFTIDVVEKGRTSIKIKAIDNMIKLDRPYELSNISYPSSLYQIYVNICNVCDVQIGSLDFPNKDYLVHSVPDGDYSFRDILGYVSELAGCFSKVNRNGALEVRWYYVTDTIITPNNRFKLSASDNLINITGVEFSTDTVVYRTGTEGYVIDISNNPLLQGDYNTVLPIIFNNVSSTTFTPYESDWQGNPAIQAGDMLTHIDVDDNVYNTIVTSSTYKYRGSGQLSAKGKPRVTKGYKGSTDKRINNIVYRVEKQIGDKLTTLQEAQLNATELMTNMLGGHLITDEENGALYIADNPDITLATKIWKWGTGGFGYSDNGGQTYNTAITADGSIVAELVSAGIITGDMVQTGILQSEDGGTWVNLNDGTFNFQNKMSLIDGTFNMEVTDEIVTNVENRIVKIGELETRLDSVEANMNFRYQQDTPPENPEVGDVWFNTNPNGFIVDLLTMTVNEMVHPVDYYSSTLNKSYRWTGTTWEHVEDGAITELRTSVSNIEQTAETITTKVSSLETDAINLELRVNNAEQKITPTAITSTVESNTTTLAKKSDIPDITNFATKSEVTQTSTDFTLRFNKLKSLDGEIIEGGVTKISIDGIVVSTLSNRSKLEMLASSGFVLWSNTGYGLEKKFYVDTSGKIQAKSLVIAGDSEFKGIINVGTDASIGNNLYLGTQGTSGAKGLYFNNNSNIVSSSREMLIESYNGLRLRGMNGGVQIGSTNPFALENVRIYGSGTGIEISTAIGLSSSSITLQSSNAINLLSNGTYAIYDVARISSATYPYHDFRVRGTSVMRVEKDGVDFMNKTPKNLNIDRTQSVQDKNYSTRGIEFRIVSEKLQYKSTSSSTWKNLE